MVAEGTATYTFSGSSGGGRGALRLRRAAVPASGHAGPRPSTPTSTLTSLSTGRLQAVLLPGAVLPGAAAGQGACRAASHGCKVSEPTRAPALGRAARARWPSSCGPRSTPAQSIGLLLARRPGHGGRTGRRSRASRPPSTGPRSTCARRSTRRATRRCAAQYRAHARGRRPHLALRAAGWTHSGLPLQGAGRRAHRPGRLLRRPASSATGASRSRSARRAPSRSSTPIGSRPTGPRPRRSGPVARGRRAASAPLICSVICRSCPRRRTLALPQTAGRRPRKGGRRPRNSGRPAQVQQGRAVRLVREPDRHAPRACAGAFVCLAGSSATTGSTTRKEAGHYGEA